MEAGMTIAPRDRVRNALNDLSQLLVGQETVNATLQRIAALAVILIDAVDHAGVTAAHDSRPATDAATGGVVYEVKLRDLATELAGRAGGNQSGCGRPGQPAAVSLPAG
jgi:hypothetical protein